MISETNNCITGYRLCQNPFLCRCYHSVCYLEFVKHTTNEKNSRFRNHQVLNQYDTINSLE